MTTPLKIRTRQFPPTESIEREVRDRFSQLERVYDRITGAHVTLEAPIRHHRKGGPFAVRIDVAVPGSEILVTRTAAEDLYVAIREAFGAARRRLEEHADRLHHDVKAHSRA